MKLHDVCRYTLNDRRGFTLIESMFGLLVVMMFSGLFLLLTQFTVNTHGLVERNGEEELALFMMELNDDFQRADDYWVDYENNTLHLLNGTDGKVSVFEQYEDKIRRQVNGMGHEVYMQYVDDFQIEKIPTGIFIKMDLNGTIHRRQVMNPDLQAARGGGNH